MCELQTPAILGLFKIRGNSSDLVIETDCMTSEAFSHLGNSVTRKKKKKPHPHLQEVTGEPEVSAANQIREVQN